MWLPLRACVLAQMKSVALALQVALHRLQIKNHGRVVSKDKLMHAFEFMDTDGSGALSLEEVQDAFNAMSIYVTPEVRSARCAVVWWQQGSPVSSTAKAQSPKTAPRRC